LKVGIVLSLGAFACWGYKIADRTIIAASLSLKDLGLYAYAMSFIMFGWDLFADFGRVLQPILWKKSGEANNIIDAFADTRRIAIYLAVSTALAIPFSQLCFYMLVNLITINYVESLNVFYVLSCNLYLASIIVVPNLIFSSKVVNKQIIPTVVYSIGLILNIIFDLIAIRLGYGIGGVAWVTVITQGVATFVSYFLVQKYMFVRRKEFIFFVISILVPFFISIGFTFLHVFLTSIILNPLIFAAISLLMQIVLWSIVIRMGYSRYFSKDKIFDLVNQVVGFLKNKLKRCKAKV